MRTLSVGRSTVLLGPLAAYAGASLTLAAAASALGVDRSALVAGRRCPECGSADHGQPFVEFADGRTSGCWVSLARSEGFEAAAVRLDGPVGIDIESRTAVAQHPVAATLLHPAEAEEFQLLDATQADARLASLWVAKEALLKATGYGLRVDPRGIQLRVDDGVDRDRGDGDVTLERWPAELALTTPPQITLFEVTDDIVGALAEL